MIETSNGGGGGGGGGGGAAGGAAVVVMVGGGSSRTEAEEVELYWRRHRRHGRHLRDRCCLLAEGERRDCSAVGLKACRLPPCPDYKLMAS